MRVPGGIRTTLAVALLAIVGGALGGAYLMVVPSLERRLVDARIDQLEEDGLDAATAYARLDQSNPFALDQFVDFVSALYRARVVVFQVLGPEPTTLSVLADSAPIGGSVRNDPVAKRTAETSSISRGRVERRGLEFGESAIPLYDTNVMLLSASVEDQLATVRVVKRRLLYATGVALLIAAILGTAAATVHARRIRRLERAANRIAEGQFDEPVVDLGDDELGELAMAFEEMRIQLSQLDTARKEFVANASHELRTPLFSLAGFLELMADEDLDEETRAGFLATTREQVDRLTKLAADLLDLSRMDAGRLRVEQEEVVLADVARTVVEELSALAETTGHRLTVDADRRRVGARRRGARAADRPRARRERADAHPVGHRGADQHLGRGRARRAHGLRRRPRHPTRARRADLRPLLSRRGPAGVGQRPRARDRARARGADGRLRRARQPAREHALHALAAPRPGHRFHVKTV